MSKKCKEHKHYEYNCNQCNSLKIKSIADAKERKLTIEDDIKALLNWYEKETGFNIEGMHLHKYPGMCIGKKIQSVEIKVML